MAEYIVSKYTLSGNTSDGVSIKGLSANKKYTDVAQVVEGKAPINTTARDVVLKNATPGAAVLPVINYFGMTNDEDVANPNNIINVGFHTGTETVFHSVPPGGFITLQDGQINTNISDGTIGTLIDVTSISLDAEVGTPQASWTAF